MALDTAKQDPQQQSDPIKNGSFTPIALQDLYILFYRKGQNPYPMQKNFVNKGGLSKAIDAGKNHCDRITARFLRVDPFIRDLSKEETDYLSSE